MYQPPCPRLTAACVDQRVIAAIASQGPDYAGEGGEGRSIILCLIKLHNVRGSLMAQLLPHLSPHDWLDVADLLECIP